MERRGRLLRDELGNKKIDVDYQIFKENSLNQGYKNTDFTIKESNTLHTFRKMEELIFYKNRKEHEKTKLLLIAIIYKTIYRPNRTQIYIEVKPFFQINHLPN